MAGKKEAYQALQHFRRQAYFLDSIANLRIDFKVKVTQFSSHKIVVVP